MFAFAAYDRRAQILHLVRDPFGMKPLFYTEDKSGIAFSSWPSSLLALSGRQWTFDADGLWEYFLLGYTFSGKTLVREINEVAPGDHLIVGANSIKRRQFAALELESRQVSSELFFETLEAVVDSHSSSDVPAALFLSGGVDSSVLQLALPDITPFHLFSDEREFARRVAEHVGQTLDVRDFGETTDIDEKIKQLTLKTGLTFFSPIQPLIISEAMANAGYKVAFSANGGDELFLGYPRIATPGFAPDLSGLKFERPSFQDFDSQIRHIFRSPETILVAGRSPCETAERAADFLSDQRNRVLNSGIPEDAAYRWFDIETSIKHNLNPTTDATSMLYGVEVRTPFIDRRLVSCALSMAPNVLIKSDVGRKAPLKAYLRSKGLPDDIFLRPKMGFSLNREASFKQRNARLAALKRLSDLDIFRYRPSTGMLGRDFAYVAAASQAAVAWYDGFIETGIVSL
jgi:asparagine synthase (glutamine-hydrolysing)